MNAMTPKFGMGAPLRRKEDKALLTGQGRFTDDVKVDGALEGYVLRSPIAAGSFTIGSLDEARNSPGIHLILTSDETAHLGDLKSSGMQKQPDGSKAPTRDIPILCSDRVRHVGDAMAFIVADSRDLAQDAADLIDISFDAEPAATQTKSALDEEMPLVWPEAGSNQAFLYELGDRKITDGAFSKASHVTRIQFVNNRLIANYMETRSAVAVWDGDHCTLTTGSQGVFSMRDILAKQVFGMPADKLRVLTHDVGGGFGTKAFAYREYALIMEAAKRLGRPVKWTADRTEHFLCDAQGRDNYVEAEMAMDEEGRFLGLRIDLISNMGAYAHQYGPFIPYMGATMSTGVYDIQALDVTVRGVYTNTAPVDAYRGAGRPEAAFLIEKLADACARDLGLDPLDIRRRNFIRPEQFPYKSVTGRNYDVGEFDGHLTEAMKLADHSGFADRVSISADVGKLRGFGIATYVEACAFAGSEPAHLTLEADGSVTLMIGTQSNGQGHATAYAQLAAEHLGLDIEKINLRQGDTSDLKKGGGTGGSRSIPLGGVSVARAGEDLAGKIKRLAADQLEADAADIELAAGEARIVGTDRALSFTDIAAAATDTADLKGFAEYRQDEATYPNGTHVCEVEVDPETGHIDLLAYLIVDDFGAVLNPLLLEGQVHGGVVQGIGQALMEQGVYGEDGQLMTASFMDYAMPRADDIPRIDFQTRNVPSTTNAMGMKGAGEAGSIGSTPAVLNAVTDALWRAHGIRHIDMPLTPLNVWTTIRQAEAGAGKA